MAAFDGSANAPSSTGAVLVPEVRFAYVSKERVTAPEPVSGSPGTDPPGGGVEVGPGVAVGEIGVLVGGVPAVPVTVTSSA